MLELVAKLSVGIDSGVSSGSLLSSLKPEFMFAVKMPRASPAPSLIGSGAISDSDGATSSSAARNILEESIQQKVMDRFDAIQIRRLGKSESGADTLGE